MKFDVVYKKRVKIDDLNALVTELSEIVGPDWVSTEEADLVAYSKDYQLITNRWIMENKVPGLPHVIVWPENEEEISRILICANRKKIPVVPYGEGSGVVGAAIPVYGGIMLDMKRMTDIIEVNKQNLTVTVQTGANGKWLERQLEQKGFLIGHVPQSFHTSTVGGWIAHRAAGQFSTKYGKIEDIVLSMRVVLPNGEIIDTKLYPRASNGPQIERLFLSSEGTLGIVTQATMIMWPLPEKQQGVSFAFDAIEDSLKATQLILQKQIYPAVVRIYDKQETERHFYNEPQAKNRLMVIFVCEAPISSLVELEISEIRKTCLECNGTDCGKNPVDHWFETRFNVKETSVYMPKGQIADTIEISCMWDDAVHLYHSVINELKKLDGLLLASGHASHFYPNGVCFYFTFSGIVPEGKSPEEFYNSAWDAAMIATLNSGGSISHHHGIGINRARWMRDEHGPVLDLMKKIKHVIDPNNIMNPGKLYDEPERE
ncbi:MAG: FAD-binding oxidoreductase [Candidatus Lokiarchaeota archaeon]|nr:FAD-binding oxidoreductase [Candidatus Lokiarchaeota archaeon]